MQKIFSIVLVALLVLAVNLTFGQAIKVSQVSSPTTVDVGPQCSGGQIHDDGVAENGYGWNATAGNPSGWASKFIPTVYPYKFTKFCVGLTRLSTGVANFTFTITMWKSVNGLPTVPFNTVFMDTVTVTAAALPVWPAVSFYDFQLPSTWAPVTGTDSVYIGIKYNPVTMTGVFVASDESTTTTLWPGYCTVAAGPWTTIQSNATFAAYRSLLFRAEGGSNTPTLVDPTTVCNYGSMPLYPSGVYGHASAVLGDTLYIVGGSSTGASSTTVQRYAINSNLFSAGTPLPTPKVSGALVKCGNALYYLSGDAAAVNGVGEGLSYKYTPATGWTTIAPKTTPVVGYVGMNWGDSVIFCVSGGWATYSTTVEFYRPGSNTWGTSTPMTAGTGRRSFAGGLDANKIVVAGGFSGTFRNDCVVGTIGANATTITWATGPVIPFGYGITGSSRPGGTAVNGKFYFVSGEVTGGSAGNGHDTIYVYDIAANLWNSQRIAGRAPNQASNYWAAITNWVSGNGKIKIFIPGGIVGTTIPGLYTLQVDPCTVTGIIGNGQIPEKYDLSQNYPNPFNPETKINYALPKSGLVTLKIYDVLGREVMTLVNEMKSAGKYSIDFNGANLSSGIYFYTLKSGDFTSVKKMTLIK